MPSCPRDAGATLPKEPPGSAPPRGRHGSGRRRRLAASPAGAADGATARSAPSGGARGERRAWFLVSLERLEEVGLALGDAAARAALALARRRLRVALGAGATIARTGGGRLLAIASCSGEDAALALAARVLRVLGAPVAWQGLRVCPEPAAGIALDPGDGEDATEPLRRAGLALAEARVLPERLAVYRPGREPELRRRLLLAAALERALARGSLALHFQPLLRLPDLALLGAEALLRWRDRGLGTVAPAEFVPLAERTGLVHRLTHLALARALAVAARGRRHHPHLEIAVNLSARDLLDHTLPARLRALLARHRLPASALSLELTESAALEAPERSLRTLAHLRELGCRIALDDFGTGRASLTLLHDLPIDTLKLDASFVRRIADSARDRAIVAATIALARRLGLRTIAEGVENPAVLERLCALRCDAAQGHWLGAPAPAAALLALARSAAPLRRSRD